MILLSVHVSDGFQKKKKKLDGWGELYLIFFGIFGIFFNFAKPLRLYIEICPTVIWMGKLVFRRVFIYLDYKNSYSFSVNFTMHDVTCFIK